MLCKLFLLLAVAGLVLLFDTTVARYADRYDLNQMPFDLRPVKDFIGLWEIERKEGHYKDLPPPSLIDFAINPIPKFGARTVNISHTYFDESRRVVGSDYGYMPVKNATRRDPRVHVAYLTTSSDGYSMMEQGFFDGNKLSFHLKQFMKRTFDVGSHGTNLDVRSLDRQYDLIDFHHMSLSVRASTNTDNEAYTAYYRKILY